MSDKMQDDDVEKVDAQNPTPITQFEAGYSDRWTKQLLTWGVEARGLFQMIELSYLN